MLEFTTTRLTLDIPASIDAWSRLVCQEGGNLLLAVLESQGATGTWAVVDIRSASLELGRGLAPVTDGRLGRAGDGLLLTHRGLARVDVSGRPRVLGARSAGLGTGKAEHEQCMEMLGDDVAIVGRWLRPFAKLVRVSTGEVIRRVRAQPPFLAAPARQAGARVWALGEGAVLTFDRRSWETVERSAAPRALAACWTPLGAVAVLGSVASMRSERLGHAVLRDIAPVAMLRRLRSPFTGLRLALLDERFRELASDDADWLWRALPDPDGRGVGRMAVDGAGRAVLSTSQGLTVVDPGSLRPLGRHRTDWHPASWAGASRAVHCAGGRELTVIEWRTRQRPRDRRDPAATMDGS